MYLIFFICSSVDGHLSCVLAIVNSASVNTGVLVTLQILVLSGFMPSSGITESYGNSVFGFLSNFHILFSYSGCTILYSHQQCNRVPFSSHPFQHLLFVDFNDGHSDWCELVPHCSFDLHFSNNDDEHLFMCLLAPICLLWRNVCLDLLPIFTVGLFVFLLLNCLSCLCSLDFKPLLVASFADIFFPVHRLFFLVYFLFPFLYRSL